MKKKTLLVSLAALSLLLSACGNNNSGDSGNNNPQPGPVEPQDATLVSIEITALPKTQYTIGEELDLTGLVVKGHYSDGSNKEITDYQHSNPDMSTAGNKVVTISSGNQTATFSITVSEEPVVVTLVSISISKLPTKQEYKVGESFDSTGLEVTAHYSDNSSEVVAGYTLSSPDMSTEGKKAITVTYEGETASFEIEVKKEEPVDVKLSLEEFDEFLEDGIESHQNYTANISTTLLDTGENFVTYNFYSINGDAIFEDSDQYFYYGYIRQKDQGVVDFSLLKNGSAINPGTFYSTRPDLDLGILYEAAVVNLFDDADFKLDTEHDNTFISESIHSMAVIASLGIGLYASNAENPENFKVEVASDLSSIKVTSIFTVFYQAEEEGSLDETFKEVDAKVEINITNIGSTHNEAIENYVANPDYVYVAPTKWSDTDEAFIKGYFNGVVPPFVDNLSYSYELGKQVSSGTNCAAVVDYDSGDLTEEYGAKLLDNGFTKVSNTEYVKKEEEDNLIKKYSVIMRFYAPTDKDKYGQEYSVLFPKGIFQVKYVYTTSTKATVTTVGALKDYLKTYDLESFLKLDGISDTNQVSGFKDGTANANNADESGTSPYYFVAPSSTGTFKIYMSYEQACALYKAQCEYLDQFNYLSSSKGLGQMIYSSDDSYDQIQFTNMDQQTSSNYQGYIQFRIRISKAFYEGYLKSSTPIDPTETHSISYFSLDDNYDLAELAHVDVDNSTLPSEVKVGETVNVKIVASEGYKFAAAYAAEEDSDPVNSQLPDEGMSLSSEFSFVMPDYDVQLVIICSPDTPAPSVLLSSITLSGYKTEYEEGEIFSFDGVVTAHYSDGSSKEVEPTYISSPNTTTTGEKEVVIKYEENGVEVQESYIINVNAKSQVEYSITVVNSENVTITVTTPTSLKAIKDTQCRFTLSVNGNTDYEVKVLDANNNEVEVSSNTHPMTGVTTYFFNMPESNVTIKAIEGGEDPVEEKYSISYVGLDDNWEVCDVEGVDLEKSTLPSEFEAGDTITLKAELLEGYSFDYWYFIGEDEATQAVWQQADDGVFDMTSTEISFVAPEGDLQIAIVVSQKTPVDPTPSDKTLNGKYTAPAKKLGGVDTYFSFTFNEDGSGEFSRDPASSSDSSIKKCYFSYTVKDNEITITLTDVGDGMSSFASYRPFASDSIGATAKGTINEDGSVTFNLYTYSGSINATWTFSK